MVFHFQEIVYRWFIRNLYVRDASLYFPVVSNAPQCLNFAYPDFSVQYFVTTFHPGKITLRGEIPMSKLHFFSIAIYGTDGLPIYSKSDADLGTNQPYAETITLKTVAALIVRFYRKDPSEHFDSYLPEISIPKKKVTMAMRISASKTLGKLLLPKIVKQNRQMAKLLPSQPQFFKPDDRMLKSLFPNPFAHYLIAKPSSQHGYIDITTPVFRNDDYRFVGFMASNYSTTETDDSISLPVGKKQYRIWFGIGPAEKHMKYYLRWKSSNQFPILVYREVRLKKQGLAKHKIMLGPVQLQTIMNYPKINYSK
jgi:hypothetical protein